MMKMKMKIQMMTFLQRMTKKSKKYAFDPTFKIHQFRKKSDPKISYLSERRKTKDKILKDVLKKQNQVRESENTSNQNEMYTRSTMVGRVVV